MIYSMPLAVVHCLYLLAWAGCVAYPNKEVCEGLDERMSKEYRIPRLLFHICSIQGFNRAAY